MFIYHSAIKLKWLNLQGSKGSRGSVGPFGPRGKVGIKGEKGGVGLPGFPGEQVRNYISITLIVLSLSLLLGTQGPTR